MRFFRRKSKAVEGVDIVPHQAKPKKVKIDRLSPLEQSEIRRANYRKRIDNSR